MSTPSDTPETDKVHPRLHWPHEAGVVEWVPRWLAEKLERRAREAEARLSELREALRRTA